MRRDRRLMLWMTFDPHDLWIGVLWKREWWGVRAYVCVVPCFPIVIDWRGYR
jgi:hypothetical protein